eukprot:55619-Eustigmatos_ZCMA.PRE.1
MRSQSRCDEGRARRRTNMGHRRRWCGVAAGLAMLGVAIVPRPIKAGWIDPSTQADAYTARSNKDGEEYHLVMSDEFDVENR